ncbi:MAG: hypothetical protein ACLTMP_06260 [Eggerthella lenta]
MARKDGTWFWTLDKGRVVEAEDGRLAIRALAPTSPKSWRCNSSLPSETNC